jgi:transcriptional regulator with XRE-family HTH domain
MFTAAQCRGARGIINWTQERLATEAGVSLSTVKDFESGRRTPIANNLAAIQHALEAAGVEFTNGDQPGVRLVKPAETAVAAPADRSKPPAGTKTPPGKKTRQGRS